MAFPNYFHSWSGTDIAKAAGVKVSELVKGIQVFNTIIALFGCRLRFLTIIMADRKRRENHRFPAQYKTLTF